MVASGEKGEARSPGFRVLRPGPEKWGAMDVRSAPPPRAPHGGACGLPPREELASPAAFRAALAALGEAANPERGRGFC